MTQEERNAIRSTGSAGGHDPEDLEDPTEEVREYFQQTEEAYQQEQLEGQTSLPGFEEEKAPLNAERIKRNARMTGFKVDYLKDPEDALIYWDAPSSFFSTHQARYYKGLVNIAAKELGVDPEQLADKDKRTPEQEQKLLEVFARSRLARVDAFFSCKYYNALCLLDPEHGKFEETYYSYKAGAKVKKSFAQIFNALDQEPTPETGIRPQEELFVNIKVQSCLYFFATHEDLWPTSAGKLTEAQAAELREIFTKLDQFYMEKAGSGADLEDLKIPYSQLFLDFIERENPTTAEEIIEAISANQEIIEAISVNQIDGLVYPLDKANSSIWDSFNLADADGQLQYRLNTSKNNEASAEIYLGLDFDSLPVNVKKNLTHYDKHCMIAAAALFNGGNPVMSATQIYKQMGSRGSPSENDIKKINDSCTKMGLGWAHIDNTNETEQNKGYPVFSYDGPILPFERVTKYINGQLCDSAIHLFREPPLITFARERKQITTIPRELLESPVSKTEANLTLQDYLLERISHMKSGKKNLPRKILLKTLYEKCNITGKQRQRTPDKIARYLDHYKKCNWIAGYSMDNTAIKIALPD